MNNIVLVHGGFVDGSGWEGVYRKLTKDGYNVSIVQNPTLSLADDVAVTKRTLRSQDGPVILVGHSYGGAVITEAGNDPKVVGLVYITALSCRGVKSSLNLVCLRFWLGSRFRWWHDLVNSYRRHPTDFIGECLLAQMRVPLRHANIGVSELLSNFSERQPLPRPSARRGVPQFVEG